MGQYFTGCIKDGNKWKGLDPFYFFNGRKLTEHSYIGNMYVNAFMSLIYQRPSQVVWAGDYADNERNSDRNIHELCEDINEREQVKPFDPNDFKYLVNHDKELYIDLSKGPKDDKGWVINPLPILTAEGSRGNGDYRGTDMELVGTWARDTISIESEVPNGYTERYNNFLIQ